MTADGVYALRYASRTKSFEGEHFFGHPADCHVRRPIDYFTWVIVHDGVPTVFDTGFTREEAERRGDRPYAGTPSELLGVLGFEPADVRVVVLSHLHYDHTGHLDSFPDARILVQRSEVEFWEGPFSHRGAYAHLRPDADLIALRRLIDGGRVDLLDGDAEVTPRISVHAVGGHTAGTQVLRVCGESGTGPIVLASDASHFYANVDDDRPYGTLHDVQSTYAAFDRLRELAGSDGVIVPGHDPLVAERHEPLATDPRIILLRPRPGGVNREETP
jgi:glyoxylase-like metal-dependent hydrolase (beta-lactamase superfamily II)